jgi:hypothetical protein
MPYVGDINAIRTVSHSPHFITGFLTEAWMVRIMGGPGDTPGEGVGKMIARALGGKILARILVLVALGFGLLALFKGNVASLNLSQEAGIGVCLLAVAALVGRK